MQATSAALPTRRRILRTAFSDVMQPFGRMDFTTTGKVTLPLYESRIPAGSPSAAADDVERQTTLNDILLHHPRETFLLRVTGDSMIDIGMQEGDLLTVDRKLPPRHGDTVVACIDGLTTVKTLHQKQGEIMLLPQNKKYQPIEILSGSDFTILGVVTNIIRALY